ncbi:MarR family winged helix-turn-helix transcriptional regulator [Ectobacillus ponti]|uniref:MarR family transcriptional regulator n=1 Tax=Ectobacillus ponti TaxID=2961894 RepID=A0AA42BUF4_9BACI|nr:MarR family transcriptional regulator [Ectobacillus ponti]MCP8970483.1 MarR family transcriptional regulator [Ectobacillus ponti]
MNTEHEKLVIEVADHLRLLFRSTQQDLNELFVNDIPLNEFATLRTIHLAKRPMMASELAYSLRVTSSHITAVTDRLYKKGLITRERSDTDRRIVYMQITEPGKEMAAKLERVRTDYYIEKFTGLNGIEMTQLKELLVRIL